MKKSILLFISILIILINSNFVFAQSSDEEEDIIVVSAGKIQQNLEDTVEHVQVLSEEEIKETGAKTLTEAIKNLSGVTVKTASAGNPTDSISMQGFSSAYVKILVDGIEVSGDIGGSTASFSIPLEDVDHIEVIQGATSSLYGSDAMGGVINIITKKTENPEEGIKFTGSIKDEFSASIIGDLRNYTGIQTKLAFKKLAAGLTGCFDYAPGAKKEANDVLAGLIDYYETPKKMIGYAKGTVDWNDKWGSTGVYGLYNFADQLSNFSPVGFDKSSTMEYDTKRAEAGLTAEIKAGKNLTFSGFTSAKYFNLFTEQNVKAGLSSNKKDDHTDSAEWESEVRSSWIPDDINTVLVGIHTNLETIQGDSFGDEMQYQWLLSSYVQDTLSFFNDSLSVVPGGRIDISPAVKNSDFLFQATPKLSLKYDINKKNTIRFAYGMGYKCPTLKQKYWVFQHSYAAGAGNFILNGNPDLKSETSQSINLRYEGIIANLLKIDSGIYFNYVNDMISSVVTDATCDPQLRTYVNINNAITFGGDVTLSTKLDRIEGKVSYAYTNAFEKSDGYWKPLTLRVNHRIAAGIAYKIPVVELKSRLDLEWDSPQLISSDETDGDVYSPDYLMLGAYLGKSFFNEKLEIYLRGDNLLNNLSFINGTDGSNQKTYYGLNSGTTFTLGANFKW